MDNWRNKKKIPRDKSQWKHDHPKPMRHSKKNGFKRKVDSNSILPQNTRKTTPNKQPNLMPEATRERSMNKTLKVSRRKEIIKTRAEINEIEKTRSMKLKADSLKR